MKKIAMLIFLLNFSVLLGCSGPWKGKVIDVETKEPLEEVVVLAVWQRVYRTPAGGSSYFYEAKEVVTNKAGEFEIPSYTPINLLPVISYMKEPEFTIFKPGYGSVNSLALGGYFTGKKIEAQDYEKEGRRFRYAPGVVELPRLKTRDERMKLLPGSSDPFMNHFNKKNKYMELLNNERTQLGLDPVGKAQ